MSRFGPDGLETLPHPLVDVPGVPTSCRSVLVERDRWEWRVTDGGDPAALIQAYLAEHGLDLADLARPGGHHPDGPCGAALFVSAAAGTAMAGAHPGPPTPIPALPDVAVVVYDHARPHLPDPPPPSNGGWRLGPWRDSWTPRAHADAVQAVRAAIGRGDVYQVNVVGHAAAPYTGDPRPALARLGALPGARYGGTLHGAGWALGCASPETLIEVTAGRAVTRPIKGTRPATPAGRRGLLASAKERAEHVMIVDLERNDLARVARTGSVRVDELFTVRRWCDLWQAESTVSAALAAGCGLADLLRAVCPGGSVTGAPKRAALDRIAALEPVGRGASMGGFGWVTAGRVDLGLTIRTAAADADRLHVWAGGGITWDSDPAAEVAEAAAKAAPLRALLADPGGVRHTAGVTDG
ncbi:chorismate-binding protein [Micromonospora sp. NPDC000089]|uniref:chorismate-binding protein n=1 Tax=unclassified Micromonospora TaxID=2617518 RepID=UPI0036851CFE